MVFRGSQNLVLEACAKICRQGDLAEEVGKWKRFRAMVVQN